MTLLVAAKSTVPQKDFKSEGKMLCGMPPNFIAHNQNIFIPIEKKTFITTTPEFSKYFNLSL